MSSINPLAPSAKSDRNVKSKRNPTITLHILEIVLTQYLFPECTWDDVEECVGWCHCVVIDPTPLRRIGWE